MFDLEWSVDIRHVLLQDLSIMKSSVEGSEQVWGLLLFPTGIWVECIQFGRVAEERVSRGTRARKPHHTVQPVFKCKTFIIVSSSCLTVTQGSVHPECNEGDRQLLSWCVWVPQHPCLRRGGHWPARLLEWHLQVYIQSQVSFGWLHVFCSFSHLLPLCVHLFVSKEFSPFKNVSQSDRQLYGTDGNDGLTDTPAWLFLSTPGKLGPSAWCTAKWASVALQPQWLRTPWKSTAGIWRKPLITSKSVEL